MDRAVSEGLLKCFDASFRGHSKVTITHLLFADDTLVFSDAEYCHPLRCEITPVRVGDNIKEMVKVQNYKVGSLLPMWDYH